MEATTKSVLEGLYKTVYGDELVDLIPENVKLMRMIPFQQSAKLGDQFEIPVIVSDEQGATYAGPDDDNFDLEDPEPMATKPSRVKGSQILMRAALGYKAAASAVSGGKAAFMNATELLIKRLMFSLNKRIEVMHLYGRSGLAKLASSTNQSTTQTRLTIVTGEFAPGIWVGSKGVKVEAWLADVQVGSAAFTVHKVDIQNRYLFVTGAIADIAALDTAVAANPDDIDLFYKGAKDGATLKEALGLDKIITTSGTLFNIDNSTYDLFKGQEFSAGNGPLSFDKVTEAMVQLSNYGLEGDVDLLVSPKTWQDLNKDEAALREYDVSYKPGMAERGNEEISYRTQVGKIRIHSHSMIKEGEAFIIKRDVLRRVGAWDASMKTPGYGGDIFRQLDGQAGFEIRAYTDQAIHSHHPSWLLKIDNIVNSSV